MFQIMNVAATPHAIWNDCDGKPWVFATGKEAADYCTRENYYFTNPAYGIKLQPRRVADDGSWKERERARFAAGEYVALPWIGQPWFDAKANELADLFAHVSTVDGAKIAYTEDGAKGMADRQTRVKPGKFLAKYFPELATEEVARLSVEYSKAYEDNKLHIVSDPDDWERVYTTGPHSCMAHRADYYSSSVHPVRVYAGPDLQLAYLEREGHGITARAIIWPEKKAYGRIYGDEARLSDLLSEVGYKEGSLGGARILKIEENGGYVMPYVDYCEGATVDGKYIVIGEGEIATDNTCGLSEETPCCSCCDSRVRQGEGRHNQSGDFLCDDCYSEQHIYCEYYDEDMPADDGSVEVIVGRGWSGRPRTQSWCQDAFDNHGFICDHDGEAYSDNLAVHMANGETWSTHAFEEHGFVCAKDSDNYPLDEMVEVDGEHYHRDNAPSSDDDSEADDSADDAPAVAVAAPKAPARLTVGHWAECISYCPTCSNQFHRGGRYLVTRVFNDEYGGEPRISVAADDKGDANGWCASNFRPCAAPAPELKPGQFMVRCVRSTSMGFTIGKVYLASRAEGMSNINLQDDDGDARWRPVSEFVTVEG
jgi:hypothetical protein